MVAARPSNPPIRPERWPALPLEQWKDTYATLHRWSQIVGKVRLAGMPWINHSWHVTLYVTARGLTTGLVPHDEQSFQVDFDFVDHRLLARTPWVNHSWHVTLYVTARGLTTGLVPHDAQAFQVDFDFVDHRLVVRTTAGRADGGV